MKETKYSVGLGHGLSKLLHSYADWRIGATPAEKRCHKMSDSILLTFDDFGEPQQIKAILDVLNTNNIKAMFFIQADWAAGHKALLKTISQTGHIIGNHTFSHPNLSKMSNRAINSEITNGLAGPWLRAPYGRYNRRIRRLANQLGFAMCYWSIDSRDWTGASVNKMRHTILSELQPGAVILFHMHGKNSVELLPSLISEVRQLGYEFTKPNETWAPVTKSQPNLARLATYK
jgi:peptidoglycan/xylan/chitin deacetylase (PgdA/CDA1 family)